MAWQFFLQKRLKNNKNWISFVFNVLPEHIKIKLLVEYKSVCSRVVKDFRSQMYSNIGSDPDGARYNYNFFFNSELVYCLQAFRC